MSSLDCLDNFYKLSSYSCKIQTHENASQEV